MSGKKKTVGAGALLGLLGGALAHANPQGVAVASGQATFSHPSPGTLNVTNSSGAILNWQSFSIGAGETTRFIQPNAASAVLNRVVGQNPSDILGQLLSNGHVYLINPNGIVFGPNARVDTAGLIASTLNMSDEDFKAGRLKFQGGPDAGGIKNQGYIKAGPGGEVVLIAPRIENSGIVETPDGKLILAAGQSVRFASLDFDDIVFQVQAPENQVVNLGQLIAEHGAVGVFAGGIRNSGTISADSASVNDRGQIVLSAQGDIHLESTSTVTANGPAGGDIRIESKEGTTWTAGNVETKRSEGVGGSIHILGERVAVLDGASVDASGKRGGGEILAGGDYQGKNPDIHNAKQTYVATDATLKADAVTNGDGGKVIVWGDETTQAYGQISARGGSRGGDGGFIETSGHWLDVAGSKIDASAAKGRAGTWLLDPYNLNVVLSPGNAAIESPPLSGTWFSGLNASDVLNTDIEARLNGGTSVVLQTTGTAGDTFGNGDINVLASIAKTAGPDATLTFKAHNSVIVDPGVAIGATAGKLNVVFNADVDGNGAGYVEMNTGSSVTSNGGSIVMGGGSCDINGCSGNATGTGINTNGITLDGVGLNSGGGNIVMRGAGALLRMNDAHGIYINSSTLQSGTGDITLVGTGGINDTATTGGVFFDTTLSTISTNGGALKIDGTGAQKNNKGIYFGQVSLSSAAGPLTLTGSGAGTGEGLFFGNFAPIVGGAGQTGPITLIAHTASGADSIFIDTTTTLRGAGTLTLQPLNAATTIGLAGGTGTFNLDNGELGTIQNGFADIVIGHATGSGAIAFGSGSGPGFTFLDNLTLRNPGAGSGGISINDPLSTGTNNLTFDTTGAVNQTSTLTANLLRLNGAGGNYNLGSQNNAIATLTGSTGTVSFRDDTGLDIAGLTTTGNTTLSSAGAVTQSGVLSAAQLALNGKGGSYSLGGLNNAIATLTGSTGTVSFRDDTGFDIAGLTTTGNTTLNTLGAVTQSGVLSAAQLALNGAGGSYSLGGLNNAIAALTGSTGTVSFRDDTGFDIAGLTTTGNTTLISAGTVTQSNVLAVGTSAGNLVLDGSGMRYTLDGSDSLTVGGNLTINLGATLIYNGGTLDPSGALNNAGTLQLSGGNLNLDGLLTNDGTVNYSGGTIDISGAGRIDNNAGAVFNLLPGAGNLNFSGAQVFNNAGTLVMGGKTAVQIGGPAGAIFNNAGQVNVNDGTLILLAHNVVDSAGTGGDSGAYTVASGATLRFRDQFRDFLAASSVGGAGNVLFDSASGGIFNLGGTYNLAGLTTLSGNPTVNFISPATLGGFRNSGTVNLGGTTLLATPTASVFENLQGGNFNGTGTINVSGAGIPFFNDGVISPGHSPGILTIVGDFVQGPNGILNMEIAGAQPGTGFDQLVVTGSATLDGTIKTSLLNGFAPTAGSSFDLVSFQSATGNFVTTDVPSGSGLLASKQDFVFRVFIPLPAVPPSSGGQIGTGLVDNGFINPINSILSLKDQQPQSIGKDGILVVGGKGISGEEEILIIGFQQCRIK